jgi:hypothetical protein
LQVTLAKSGRPMTELEVVLVRFGAAILEREGPPNRFRE